MNHLGMITKWVIWDQEEKNAGQVGGRAVVTVSAMQSSDKQSELGQKKESEILELSHSIRRAGHKGRLVFS